MRRPSKPTMGSTGNKRSRTRLELSLGSILLMGALWKSSQLIIGVLGGPEQDLSNLLLFKHEMLGTIKTLASARLQDPTKRRTVLALTATPVEMDQLRKVVNQLLDFEPYGIFDAIHLTIPTSSTRFKEAYPSTAALRQTFPSDRVIIHRMDDRGPLTRYLGPMVYERDPETLIVVIDVDSQGLDYQIRGYSYQRDSPVRNLVQLVQQSQRLDVDAMWCLQGEDFRIDAHGNVTDAWDVYTEHVADQGVSWNEVDFCRGVGGVLFKPRHFDGFWYNQSSYHESCVWDDDRWVGFQMERLGSARKGLHLPHNKVRGRGRFHRRLGALSGLRTLNQKLESQQTCTKAWLDRHPEAFPTARES